MVTVVTGTINRVVAAEMSTDLLLTGLGEQETPGGTGYFVIQKTHENYNALYSLALVAATNGYSITVKTVGDINQNEPATVGYMFVDW
jgi:hypothetical protein